MSPNGMPGCPLKRPVSHAWQSAIENYLHAIAAVGSEENPAAASLLSSALARPWDALGSRFMTTEGEAARRPAVRRSPIPY